MTLGLSAALVWVVLAVFAAMEDLPVWGPLAIGFTFFALATFLKQSHRGLAALLGGALILGGISFLSQTALNKPAWLETLITQGKTVEIELEILNRPKAIYSNFDNSPVFGVSVALRTVNKEPASARGYLIYSDSELVRGEKIALSGKFLEPGNNSRDAFLIKSDVEFERVSAPEPTQGFLNTLRSKYVENLSGITPDSKVLVGGLAIGEISGLSENLEEKMRIVSLTHLVAVSGSNCAIVVGLVYLIAVGLRFGRFGRTVISLLALVAYVLLIGPDPSVLRAAVMTASVIVMIAIGRRSWAINALALAALILLIADPWLAVEFGFGLSVLATAGILLLAPAMSQKLASRMPLPLALALAVTLSAQLLCLPLLLQLQPGLATYSVIANLLAGPMVAPVTVLGMIALLAVPIFPRITSGISFLASLGTWVIESVALFFADLPVAYFPWATGLPATILSCILIASVAAWLRPGPIQLKQTAAAALVVIAVTSLSIPAASEILPKTWPLDNWSVVACDVGQGDALVIRSQGRIALVDVGRDEKLIDSCLTNLKISKIDLLVLTHFDFDHVGGLPGALKRREVASVIISGFPDDRPATALAIELIQDSDAQLVVADPSISGVLGDYSWQILGPTKQASEAIDSNDASVVMVFRSAQVDLLLLGDLGSKGQQRIADKATRLLGNSEQPLLLKVSHHGSNDQYDKLHLDLKPDLALISVGLENGYGHPGQSLLQILEQAGSLVLRTDTQGALAVSATDGKISWSGSGK